MKHITGNITAPRGFKACGVEAEVKYKDRLDLCVIYSEVPAKAGAVYTTNKFQAAPILVTKKHLANSMLQGVVVNAGCANACTGEVGLNNAHLMAEKTADLLGLKPVDIAVSSTGVIGVQLPMDKIETGIIKAVQGLSKDGGYMAAKAIMTTDTCPKDITVEMELDGKKVVIGGIAKGSGMIHPNMATMLAFVTTDVAISIPLLQKAVKEISDESFNMITVDGDTSTNDMLLVMANGLAGNQEITDEGENYQDFVNALKYVCQELAKKIAADGEGATKLIEVQVKSALSKEDARLAAKSICGSSLVKAAFFGEDANWGRIITAIGYSGAEFDPSQVDVYLGYIQVVEKGVGLVINEKQAKEYLEGKKLNITVVFNQGNAYATAWGCDLSYDYVKINADYRS